MRSVRPTIRSRQERPLYKGRVFDLVQTTLRLKNRHTTRLDVIRHPGAVAIVPRIGKDVILLRQYRGSIDEELYEIPAGTLEYGESPDRAAARELEEEIGYTPGRLRKVVEFYTAPGFCTERMFLYVATELKPVTARPEKDEFLRKVRLPLTQALKLAKTGKIHDAKTLVGLLLVGTR